MVVNMQRSFAAVLVTLLLLPFGGCSDVPLDIATYRTDTLALTGPGLGGTVRDTVVSHPSSPQPSDWRFLSLTWLRAEDSSGGIPRRPHFETTGVGADPNSDVHLFTVIENGRPVEYAKINVRALFPSSISKTSVATFGTSGEARRISLKGFEVNVPAIRIPTIGPADGVRLNSNIDDDDSKAGATISIPRILHTGNSGSDNSDGTIRIVRIDRRNHVLLARLEAEFRTSDGSVKMIIPIMMDMILSY